MTLIHTMGFSGSVAVIFYILTYAFTKRYLPILWHKIYLTITIFLYLIPFQLFSINYRAWIKGLLGLDDIYHNNNGIINESSRTIYVYNGSIYAHNIWLYLFMVICIIVSVCLLFRIVIRYRRLQKGIEECSNLNEDATAIISELSQRTGVKVYRCCGLDTPTAAGILRGKVILPDTELTKDRLRAVLNHELIHIKARDNLIKIILLVVVVMNFYNPLVYYLLSRWNTVAELYCDDRTLAGKSEQEKNDYANMVIDFAEGKYNNRKNPFMGLAKSAGEKQLEERIVHIKRAGRNHGIIGKVMGTLLIMIAVFSSSLTAAAYTPRNVSVHLEEEYSGNEIESFFILGDDVYLSEDETWVWEHQKYFSSDCAIVIVDEDGSIHCDTNTGDNNERCAGFNHTYANGKFMEHEKLLNGSCVIEINIGKRCSKCGDIICKQHISTLLIDICAHFSLEDNNEAIAGDNTQYIDFNLPIYSGVIVYTDSGPNNSGSAYIDVTESSIKYVEMGICDSDSKELINGNKYMKNGMSPIDIPGGMSFSSINQLPDQNICAGFYRTGISGENYVSGKFYYNYENVSE